MYSPKNLKGRKLKTVATLLRTTGIFVAEKHLSCRRSNTNGRFLQFVPGHGGDVIAVTQGKEVAVYLVNEVVFAKPVRLNYSRLPRKKKKRQSFKYTFPDGSVVTATSWAQLKKQLPELIQPSRIESYFLKKPMLR